MCQMHAAIHEAIKKQLMNLNAGQQEIKGIVVPVLFHCKLIGFDFFQLRHLSTAWFWISGGVYSLFFTFIKSDWKSLQAI